MAWYSLIDYVNLHEDYMQDKISLKEFKAQFKLMQKEDETPYNEKEKIVIKELYKEVAGWKLF